MKNIFSLCFFILFSFSLNGQAYQTFAINTTTGGFFLLTTNNRIVFANSDFSNFTVHPTSTGLSLTSAFKDKCYLVGMNKTFFYKDNSTDFTQLYGNGWGPQIVADGQTGKVWCLGSDNEIYWLDAKQWVKYAGNRQFTNIAVCNNIIYGIGTDKVIYKSGTVAGTWVQVMGGTGKRVAVDITTGKLWAIGSDDGIYVANPGATYWVQHPGNGIAKELAVHNGIPYVIALSDGSLQKGINGGWTRISNNINNIKGTISGRITIPKHACLANVSSNPNLLKTGLKINAKSGSQILTNITMGNVTSDGGFFYLNYQINNAPTTSWTVTVDILLAKDLYNVGSYMGFMSVDGNPYNFNLLEYPH